MTTSNKSFKDSSRNVYISVEVQGFACFHVRNVGSKQLFASQSHGSYIGLTVLPPYDNKETNRFYVFYL
jgi:hypothetical protein